MRLTLLLLMGGILLLSACGEEESDPTFSFSRNVTPEARSNGDLASILVFEPELATRYELVSGDGRACAFGKLGGLKFDGYLSCWGRKIHPNDRNQVGHNVNGTNNMLSIGADHLCTTLTTGDRRVHCDGSNDFGENTDPEPLGLDEVKRGHWLTTPNVVASGSNHNCALDAFGVYCWGDNRAGQTSVPVLKAPRWVSAGGDTSCAIDVDGDIDELICWGGNEHGQRDVPSNLTAISRVAVGSDFVCVSNVGQVECWGNTANWDYQASSYTNIIHISAGTDHVCVLNETQVSPQHLTAECFGNQSDTEDLLAVPAAINTNIRTISAGNGFTCATNLYNGYSNTSDDEGNFQAEEHKGILCWGENSEGQTDVPKRLCLNYYTEAIDNDYRDCPEN